MTKSQIFNSAHAKAKDRLSIQKLHGCYGKIKTYRELFAQALSTIYYNLRIKLANGVLILKPVEELTETEKVLSFQRRWLHHSCTD